MSLFPTQFAPQEHTGRGRTERAEMLRLQGPRREGKTAPKCFSRLIFTPSGSHSLPSAQIDYAEPLSGAKKFPRILKVFLKNIAFLKFFLSKKSPVDRKVRARWRC
jgi:hypothetical protein